MSPEFDLQNVKTGLLPKPQDVGKMRIFELLGLKYKEGNAALESGILEPDAFVDETPVWLLTPENFVALKARVEASRQEENL